MAKYNSKQDILNSALGNYYDLGFNLSEPDDHFTELWFKDKRIAIYYQKTVTIDIIQEGCENYIRSISRWN